MIAPVGRLREEASARRDLDTLPGVEHHDPVGDA